MSKIFTWKKYHRWFGLVLSVFMLVFCISGIILNHRSLFRSCEVSRGWMPASYHIQNFNNGIIKGTLFLRGDSLAGKALDQKSLAGNSLGDGSIAENDTPKAYSQSEGKSFEKGKVIAFGGAGVWLTDTQGSKWTDFNAGLPEGADNRNIRNIVQSADGTLWLAAQYDVYRHDGKQWQRVELPGNEERITDVTLSGDSTQVVALSRSKLYIVSKASSKDSSSKDSLKVKEILLKSPEGYKPETTLFKTVWKLHSGEFFGLPGQLVVDAIAVVLIILSITGIILFLLPYGIRSQKRKGATEMMKKMGKKMVWNQKWHNKIGYATIVLTLWLAISGMCLRPPLMIPLVLTKTSQSVEDGNVWHDKLRGIRWDEAGECWLVSTSEGFLKVDEAFQKAPVFFGKGKSPSISPMGITVFEKINQKEKILKDESSAISKEESSAISKDELNSSLLSDEWIIGSFSGLYRWNPQTGKVVDYFTGKPEEKKSMRPISNSLVSGYSKNLLGSSEDTKAGSFKDSNNRRIIIFDYAKGAQLVESAPSGAARISSANLNMPEALSLAKMSLWNMALELHVGRCYSPFLGPLSDLFVFLSGLLISLVLLSGFIILRRQKRRKMLAKKQKKSESQA